MNFPKANTFPTSIMREMACTREAWADLIACDNDYARGDRAAVEADALDFLNTIAVRLRRR